MESPMTANTDCRLVLIEWLDSRRPLSDWIYLKDAPDPEPIKCVSVGWLLRDGEVKILCQTIGDASHENPSGMGMLQIPTCSVVSVSVLREVSARTLEGPSLV